MMWSMWNLDGKECADLVTFGGGGDSPVSAWYPNTRSGLAKIQWISERVEKLGEKTGNILSAIMIAQSPQLLDKMNAL